MPKMRLDRFFSSQELLSRSELKAAVKKGAVKINDRVAKMRDEQVDTDCDEVYLHNEEVLYKPYIYIMLNKPMGVVSATEDKKNETVLSLVPANLYRSDLFPAGRLDKDTEGFVILTNDGDFGHKILSPKNHVEKFYHARLDGRLTADGISALEKGVTLADGSVCAPARLRVLEDLDEPLVEIVLTQGKYHQVKRMFGVIGLGVNSLKRTQIGGLSLDDNLPSGGCREIMHKEIGKILDK